MATLPTIFLEATLAAATEHGIEAHPLPDNQGLVLLPAGLGGPKQASLLKKMAAELLAPASPAATDHAAEATPCAEQSSIDCQVTVEERAQLFKFLTG